jgi:hypothetical protein
VTWKRNNAFPLYCCRNMSLSTMQYILKALPWKHSNAFCLLLRYTCRCQQYETRSGVHVTCPTLLSHFILSSNFSTDYHKTPNTKFTKIPRGGAALLHTDGQTEEWTGWQMDRHDEGNGLFPLFMRTRPKIGFKCNNWVLPLSKT